VERYPDTVDAPSADDVRSPLILDATVSMSSARPAAAAKAATKQAHEVTSG
jgi:hypothetical protein